MKPYPLMPQYLVSPSGDIQHKNSKHPLTPQIVTNGYAYVALKENGKRIYKGVHRLVAETWIENPLQLHEVNHIDFNKLNNCVDNLEWCSRPENVRHSASALRGNHKLDKSKVEEIKSLYKLGMNFTNIANKFSVSRQTISSVVKGNTWA